MLIDAENISPYSMENIVNKATQHGDIVLKRIYGNFVNTNGHWMFGVNGEEKAKQRWKEYGIEGLPDCQGELVSKPDPVSKA